jgi:homoserine kinase
MNHLTRFDLHIPATSANLGPGFDCLGLALDLWNILRVEYDPAGAPGWRYWAEGEGADLLNQSPENLLTGSFQRLVDVCGRGLPGAVSLRASNGIPLGSGMGSSAAAIVGGLVAANRLLGQPLSEMDLLELATEIEGHPDNVAPALLGGLVASVSGQAGVLARRFDLPLLSLVIVKPEVELPTRVARAVLPETVSRGDAVFNIGRAVLVTEALRAGDLPLLAQVMEDKIHQPYRLKHIRGAESAYQVAKTCGAAALSGAGPSLIAFVEPGCEEQARGLMMAAFGEAGVGCRAWVTRPSLRGAHVPPFTTV